MSTSSVYRVTYHWEKNGKRITETFQDNVLASASDIGSIYTVLNNNSKVPANLSQSNFYIEGIGHVGSLGVNGVLS